MLGFIVIAVIGALGFAAYNFFSVKKRETGTELMNEIAGAIREGADAFIMHEFKVILRIAIFIAIALFILVSWYTGVAFLIGATMSQMAAFVGMNIATIANVRVANTARKTRKIGDTLKVAFQGGSVMGLCVGGFALLGLGIVYLIFGYFLGQTSPEQLIIESNWMGVTFIPFAMSVSGYALGCSLIAMFNRVGGGIFTKAADMGADLVGKTEAHIPEDDPRNPATIADNVGDNVGDVAGLGSDLLESYVGAIIASITLAASMYIDPATPISDALISKMLSYPVVFASIGIISCVIGIAYLTFKNASDKPHRELNISLWTSAFLTLIGTGIYTYTFFKGIDVSSVGFKLGILSPWYSAVLGIICGIAMGWIAEYYTSYDFQPTKDVAKASVEGTALTITQGMALGMKSTFLPVALLGLTIIFASMIAGIYGVTMAALGMLSFVSATVSVDSYGPISDNAGGISEMSKLDPEVRKITDKLDSVGNTTAAIGKGFAIGSAALAALSLLTSYIHSQPVAQSGGEVGFEMILNIINPLALTGAIVGGALPFFFSGMLIEAVANAARKMVQEVRRQFNEIPGILTGEGRPDYKTCVEISSSGALKEMVIPALISVLAPLVGGFIFGADFVGGLLIGSTLSAIMLALYTANAGGAWDNGKKYIESGGIEGLGKGTSAHDAAVIGDTVGDPLKDTVGPSLDILIKIMSVVSLIGVSIFGKYNLFNLLFK
ncbi:MAG TPA: sodium-translocating pyrophosphatase [Clostridiaceae bacterium]|nr:sodium-translocating pyrophosphatase [Clostridiaceae bacterium]